MRTCDRLVGVLHTLLARTPRARSPAGTPPVRLPPSTLAVVALALGSAACGSPLEPATGGSDLMGKTFAGQKTCNTKNHDRPFIITWDATDQSTFQSHAHNDVVVVKYEGCEMTVLDACRNDSLRGAIGTYKQVEWTSGGLESIDIHDQGELYAKLPLGAVSLSGKVQSGDKLHMEYYVSGTRTASRDHVYQADLAKMPGCEGATHFVYAYNLGAFAIAAQSSLAADVDGSYFGFGGGGAKQSSTRAERAGGELASCKGESATEVESCKVPIRLALRTISPGESPEAAAVRAPETDASLSAASKLRADSDAASGAKERLSAAQKKMNAKDGKGCLRELDAHDLLDGSPGQASTSADAFFPATMRAQCLMLAGQCDAGKILFRKAYGNRYADVSPAQVDTITDGYVKMYCASAK